MPTEPTTITKVLERLAALQLQLPYIKVALPGYLVVPAQFPAFVNRAGPMQPAPLVGASKQVWTVHMRLLIGTLDQGYEGQHEDQLYELMRAVPDFFAARSRLELDGAPLVGLAGPALVSGCSGIQPFDDGLYFNIGTEFQITAPILARIGA